MAQESKKHRHKPKPQDGYKKERKKKLDNRTQLKEKHQQQKGKINTYV